MNILHVTNSFAYTGGGLVGAVSGLAKSIQLSGHEISIAAYGTEGDADVWEGLKLNTMHAKQFAGLHFFGDLKKILNAKSPDLVHTHGLWLRSSGQNCKWCKQTGTPYVVSPHGMLDPWAIRNSGWKKKLAGLWFEYAHLDNASCLHALCSEEADAIRSFGQKNPICVIPNGIDLSNIEESIAEAPWKKDCGRKALLFMGRLHPKKGLPLLLEAWADLKKSSPAYLNEWFIAIAGWSEGRHREELEARVEDLGISKDVEFLGSLHGDAKVAALSHASSFVLPSYSEGLPMSILEAWSYNLPVLMTTQCNLPEGFQAGAAISMKTNVNSIAEGLSEFFKMNCDEQLAMGIRGRELVEQRFEWKRIAAEMESVYEWILGNADTPECVQFN
jgi:poly(glycerol-phosphate) alpha-glucosyltransferase